MPTLDLSRYEGHSDDPFRRIGWCSEADIALLKDAPLLLARVKELEVANAAMLADIIACTAILDADKSDGYRAVRVTVTVEGGE